MPGGSWEPPDHQDAPGRLLNTRNGLAGKPSDPRASKPSARKASGPCARKPSDPLTRKLSDTLAGKPLQTFPIRSLQSSDQCNVKSKIQLPLQRFKFQNPKFQNLNFRGWWILEF